MSSSLSPLELSHLVEAIADPLSFNDLLSCIRVCWAWHKIFIPVLWTDVVSFRSHRVINDGDYIHYFANHSTISLIKHSHHIRAFTCTNTDLLALQEYVLLNLLEINVVIKPEPLYPAVVTHGPGLTEGLASYILCSPRLRAVSIEGLDLDNNKHVSDLYTLLTYLDNFPSITCFYLSKTPGSRSFAGMATLRAVLEQRLAHVDGSKIKSLTLRSPREMTRSKRGVPAAKWTAQHQHHWRGRERPLEESVEDDKERDLQFPRTLREERPGRWENESRFRSVVPSDEAIAVLDNHSSGVVEVCMPHYLLPGSAESLIQRFPRLTRFSSMGFREEHLNNFLSSLTSNCPGLEELEWSSMLGDRLQAFLGDDRVHLSRFSLHLQRAYQYSILQPYLLEQSPLHGHHFLRKALVKLTLNSFDPFPLAHFLEIVHHCPHLETLQINHVSVQGTEQGPCPLFACTNLKLLKLGLRYGDGWNHWDGTKDEKKALSEMALSFMEQLGSLVQLQELDLDFSPGLDLRFNSLPSPFLRLDVGVPHGLEQLSRLTKLERLVICGMSHRMSALQLEWMGRRWPRIREIELPPFGVRDTEIQFLSLCVRSTLWLSQIDSIRNCWAGEAQQAKVSTALPSASPTAPKLRAVSIEGLVLDDSYPLHRWDEMPADDPRSIAKLAALREVLAKRLDRLGDFYTAITQALSVLANDLRPSCLKEMEWRNVDWDNLASFLDNDCVLLSTFSLDLNIGPCETVLRPYLLLGENHFLGKALACLTSVGKYNNQRFENLLEIVRHCPNLQILQLDYVIVIESVPAPSSSTFACSGLQLLKLGPFPAVRNQWIGADINNRLCETAQSFMEQLGGLKKHQELDLCFGADQVIGYGGPPSPFLQLEITKPNELESLNGLERLSRLTRFERLVIRGVTHWMGAKS
ncbi:hypothetical protein BG000_009105 [Podila horticola]|nr:hypothetical protein BG000_009105 [Podila horticola]